MLASNLCRDFRILTPIMEDLSTNTRLDQATDVVLSGYSGESATSSQSEGGAGASGSVLDVCLRQPMLSSVALHEHSLKLYHIDVCVCVRACSWWALSVSAYELHTISDPTVSTLQ